MSFCPIIEKAPLFWRSRVRILPGSGIFPFLRVSPFKPGYFEYPQCILEVISVCPWTIFYPLITKLINILRRHQAVSEDSMTTDFIYFYTPPDYLILSGKVRPDILLAIISSY